MDLRNSKDILSFLKSCEIFSDFSEDELAVLLPYMRLMQFKKGEWLIREKEGGYDVYLIKSGEVEIVKQEEEGNGLGRLNVVGVGECVGEMAYFENAPRSASARALTDVEVIEFLFDKMSPAAIGDGIYSKIVTHLIRPISQRLRRADAALLATLAEKLKLTKIRAQISGTIIHFIMLFVLFFNIYKFLNLHPGSFVNLISFFPSLMIVAFGISAAWLVCAGDYPLSFYGLTLDKWKRHAFEGFLVSLPLLLLITLLKWGVIGFVPGFESVRLFESPFTHPTFKEMVLFIGLYVILVPVQEFIVRGFLQSCFRNFFHAPHGPFLAIIMSNLFFEMPHSFSALSFGISTFFFGVFWGYLFERQRSIVGVCVSHILVGAWSFFVLNSKLVFMLMG